MKKSYHISGTGKVTTYNWMFKAARLALEEGNRNEEGQFFHSMNTIVYSAFALEAFFNHLGEHFYDDWSKRERKLSKRKKFITFLEKCEIKYDLDKEPFSSAIEAFAFRDQLAHGKTEEVEISKPVELTEQEERFFTIGNDWTEFCKIENANKVFSDTKDLISRMFIAADLGDHPFLQFQSSVYNKSLTKGSSSFQG
ncbi:MAG: hypothetical protein ACR2PX_18745 [Endozoicomonas sp.]|uniref:hypothetical protein n=1 Tax=Endozoicomonas sp. TaxID=1892382 RepID=UPI003D9BEE25